MSGLGHESEAKRVVADPFSIDSLRLSQNFDDLVGVKKLLTTVPVRKPSKHEFIRVRQDNEWSLNTALLEFRDDGETYLVAQDLWQDLGNELTYKRLMTTINRQGVVFIWPLKLPSFDGRIDAWSSSALQAMEKAQTAWVKLQANRSLGAYNIYQGSDDLPDPNWPDYSFQQLLNIAFREYRIDNLEHPAIKRLQGKL